MSTITILIADDHKMVREGLHSLLESEPDLHVVGEAGSGQEAIDLVRKHEPDVIVLDIEMPGMDGIDAASEISDITGKTKILALSRHNEKQFISEMFASGAAGYILKDSAAEELINAIKVIVDGQMYCSPSLMNVVVNDYSNRLDQRKQSPLSRLSPRELEVLSLIVENKTLKEIADALHISYPTAATHRHQIMKKLDLDSDIELTKFAIREGLTSV